MLSLFFLSIDYVDHFLFSVLVKTLNWLFFFFKIDKKEYKKKKKKRINNVIIVFFIVRLCRLISIFRFFFFSLKNK